jgi:L-threonylcarbamoyladenylate synthase
MENNFFESEVNRALEVLRSGGVILYPTDTIWGLGCDALNEKAVNKIYQIKQRAESKSMIILLADERSVMQYTANPDLRVFDYMQEQTKPTTVIFNEAIGLPDTLVASDGSIGIRLTRDEFCRHLVKRLRRPLVSTSANISGHPAPKNFKEISEEVKNSVDHIVQWRQDDETPAAPSRIVKWNSDGSVEVIRD